MAVVFITNAMLTQWSDQGKVRLDDTTLTLLQENRTVKLKPAVRFTKLIDEGTPDPNKLIGKVKTKDQLVEMAAEHYMDSVILGDVGYQVVEGFLGDLSPPPAAKKAEATPVHKPAPAAAAAKKPAPAPVTVEKKAEDPLTKPPTVQPDTLQLGTPDKPPTAPPPSAATSPSSTSPPTSPPPAQTVPPGSDSGTDLQKEAEELSKLFLTTVRDS